jgi:hypothetical protein
MQPNFDDFETEPLKRPSFLTVLCILTFIGSGWAILSSVWSYATAKETVNMITHTQQRNTHDSLSKKDSIRLQKQKESAGYIIGKKISASAKTMFTVDNIHKKSIGDLIAAIFTLTGAIFMWFQKRRGFYLYIIGVAIGIALPFYLYGNDLLTVGIASFSAFFGLLFIALYALNLKTMNR